MSRPQFIYVVKPIRSDFAEREDDDENLIIAEHFEYLKQLLEDNILILAGPTLNKKFGIAVFEADSPEHAEKLMLNDPAVKKKVFSGEVLPFRVSLMKKI